MHLFVCMRVWMRACVCVCVCACVHVCVIGVNRPDLGGTVPLLGCSSHCPAIYTGLVPLYMQRHTYTAYIPRKYAYSSRMT